MYFPNSATIANQPLPEVGMGATLVFYSDRHACTISRVSKSGKTFWMKRDEAKRLDTKGMTESQRYAYFSNESESEIRVNLSKQGWKTSGGQKVWVGIRDQHFDYSF